MRHGYIAGRTLCRLVLMAATALIGIPGSAHAYPDKPIRMLVGASPGGTTDIVARLIASALEKKLKQPVAVENHPGAGGNLALNIVAKAVPDGYTIGMAYSGLAINPAIMASMPFDTMKDLAPVSLVATVDMFLLVDPKLGLKSIQDLVNMAKREPKKLALAANALGSVSHLSAALFNQRTGIDLPIAVYKGSAPALVDLMGGSVSAMFDTVPGALPLVQQNRLQVMAVGGAHRLSILPDIPTLEEAGLKDFQIGSWYGVVAPAKTPGSIVDGLSAAIAEALGDPKVRAQLEKQMLNPKGSSPAEFKSFIASEMTQWAAVARKSQIAIK